MKKSILTTLLLLVSMTLPFAGANAEEPASPKSTSLERSGKVSDKITGEAEDLFNNWNPSNPEATYSGYWYNFDDPAKRHSIMCHVYFELVSKTNSNERYAYSKYFPVTAVKGSFSHREETITQ